MTKLLIFDWGRTLYDAETKDIFPDVPDILAELRSRYELAIVCLATDGDIERRMRVIRENNIEKLFSHILMAEEGKEELYYRSKFQAK